MVARLTMALRSTDAGTVWRSALHGGESRTGWECVGPAGFARRLGRLLGMRVEPAPAPDRIAAYAARLAKHDDGTRSYSGSRTADPFGVATHLLGLRDALVSAGWQGGELRGSRRLEDLAALERQVAPPLPRGLPDLLRGLALELESVASLPIALELHPTDPPEAFSPVLRRVLSALERLGASVRSCPPDEPLAPDTTDLGKLQRALLGLAARPALEGDGSLVVLDGDTPLEAAEFLAASWHDQPLRDTACVVPAEAAVLDGALARHGLPTLGLSSASRWRPALQVLPLRLELAFRPRDPSRAVELLMLPVAPLPGRARRKLLQALTAMPGIGSPRWVEAVGDLEQRELEEAAARGDAAHRPELRAAVERWFGGEAYDPLAGIPAHAAAKLCDQVASWAQARAMMAQPHDDLLAHAAAVARTLERMLLALDPAARLTPLQLGQLHDSAVGHGADAGSLGGQAGRAAWCDDPGALSSPTGEVLWWAFLDGPSVGVPPEPWTPAEREGLVAAGMSLPAVGERRAVESWRWRRPVVRARHRLALVRWRLAGAEPTPAHPFEDELRAALGPESLERCTLTTREALAGRRIGTPPFSLAAVTIDLAPARPVAPRALWHLPPETLEPSGPLSSTALEALFGCPVRWALRYRADLGPGDAASIPDGDRLLGDFAHRLLQDLLLGPDALALDRATPAEARARCEAAFDARVEVEAAPLVSSGRDVERARARELVGRAAAALVRMLQASGLLPVAAERELSGTFGGLPLRGRLDLVVEKSGRPGLVDLKLGSGSYKRADLESGRALQLALYAHLLGSGPQGDGTPPAGFFVLRDGELLTTDPGYFSGATVVDGPSLAETLRSAESGFAYWVEALRRGLVVSTRDGSDHATALAPVGPVPDTGPAHPEPACRWCDFQTLCAVTLEGAARPAGEEVQP